MKTAVVIDELGALNRLESLPRLLSEGRKFKVCPILATQTEAQILKTYKEYETRIILQGLATKLILNCRDPQTANTMAALIGKQERVEEFTNDLGDCKSFGIRETYAILPTELQYLPQLTGYLSFSNEVGVGKMQIIPQSFSTYFLAFIPKKALSYKRFEKAKQNLIRRYFLKDEFKAPDTKAISSLF